jgi:hypothetical protein
MLSPNGRSSKSRGHRNPATSGHRRRMPADQIPAESDWNPAMVRSRPDLDGSGHWFGRIWQKMVGIRPLIGRSPAGIRQFWPNPAKRVRRNPATATGRCRIPAIVAFSSFVIFSYEPNTGKYFLENYFFWKWFHQKYFTTEIILRRNKRSISCTFCSTVYLEFVVKKPILFFSVLSYMLYSLKKVKRN